MILKATKSKYLKLLTFHILQKMFYSNIIVNVNNEKLNNVFKIVTFRMSLFNFD